MASAFEKGIFRYFAFGSNLLKERITIQNPSAKFQSIGKLSVSINYIVVYLYLIKYQIKMTFC